jgi:type III pantothenate kinase
MNLVVDVGNSLVKYAVFNLQHKLVVSKSIAKANLKEELNRLFLAYPKISNSILSASGRVEGNLSAFLQQKTKCILFSHQTPIPIQNNYHSPETLGLDRIALAVSAMKEYPDKNCLIVDLGTCITYDFVTKDGVYEGGAISPGIEMRFRAMHTFTANLPFVKEKLEMPKNYLGKSTSDCLKIGVFQAIIHEIDGFAKQYSADYKDLTLILTGGNAQILAERVKNSIFANLNFQLAGLYQILIFNINANKE